MKITKNWIKENKACEKGAEWGIKIIGDGMELDELLPKFDRADWLIWTLGKTGTSPQDLVKIVCLCARRALKFVPAAEERPRLAIEAAERWAENPTEENRQAVYAAADAAYAAYNAAYAAVYAADVAAYNAAYAADDAADVAAAYNAAYAAYAAYTAADAAYAAYAADDAAADAAKAAADAAYAAADAAYAAADAAEHKALCAEILKFLKEEK